MRSPLDYLESEESSTLIFLLRKARYLLTDTSTLPHVVTELEKINYEQKIDVGNLYEFSKIAELI